MYTSIKKSARTTSPGVWSGVLRGIAAAVLLFNVAAARAQDSAVLTASSVPTSITAGATDSVSFTLQNNGTTTWTVWDGSTGYRFGNPSLGDLPDPVWGFTRQTVSGPVIPGDSATFTFSITAPLTPGTYTFPALQMIDEGVGWFGDLSSAVSVDVVAPTATPTIPPTITPAATRTTAPNYRQYLYDGAIQNSSGGWSLPNHGFCAADGTKTTRPECLALRFPTYTTSSTCVVANGSNAPIRSWSTGVCNDTLNNANQGTCEAVPGRMWSNGVCAVTMKGHDRNKASCEVQLGGTWVTAGTCTGAWVMPNADTYSPALITGSTTATAPNLPYPSNPGPGDQCLRCHNSIIEWNVARVRDVETYLKTGHKNMSRKVGPVGDPDHGKPWAGSDSVIYATDSSGNAINWTDGTITISGTPTQLYWIYDGWGLEGNTPGAIYSAAPVAGKPAVSYSCDRCHTTGWSSDATLRTTRLPERVFPGVTWDGVSAPVTGQVNLASGITGDTNKMSSFDQFGILCSRCHSSAVDNSSNGGVPPFSAPTGMSSHHSNLTSADAGSGYCSDSRFSSQANCTDPANYWPDSAHPGAGYPGIPVGTWITPCSDDVTATQAACNAAGKTWRVSTCSVGGGTCSNSAYTTATDCAANNATWTNTYNDPISCGDAGGTYTGSKTRRGQIITALCMQCHRQESSGLPMDPDYPGTNIKVGVNHGLPYAVLSHSHGNQFLNSPHGKFTGTFAQIATATYGNGYASHFQFEGEAAGTGNGCTGCHNVHRSVVEAAGQEGGVKECQECHTGAYAKPLTSIQHVGGVGTPLEEAATDPSAPCHTCHMPGGLHFFRINTDPSYSTYPLSAMDANVASSNANTAPDGTFTRAVWVDLDLACGQCHGGGTNHVVTEGSVSLYSTSGSCTAVGGKWTSSSSTCSVSLVTLADSSEFVVGQRVSVAGMGAGGADLNTAVFSVPDATHIILASAPTAASSGAVGIIQNPAAADSGGVANYRTKAELAVVAETMHNGAAQTYPVTFSYTTSGLGVTVNASVSCAGACPSFTYDWDWGDGSTTLGGTASTSHTYGAAGLESITLTVRQSGANVGTVTRSVTLYNADAAPVASGTCTWTAETWTMQVTDTSTDTDSSGISQVIIDWGDGSILSQGAQGASFTHTYRLPGSYPVTLQAIDSALQQNLTVLSCTATPAYFTIGRTVYKTASGVTPAVPLAAASVTLRSTTTGATKTVYTSLTGSFQAAALKPGTYLITVNGRGGVTFPVTTVTVGPNSTTGTIYANP